MTAQSNDQWQRRDGYGGPESFPENGLADFAIGRSDFLSGKSFDLYLYDGREFRYAFNDKETLSVTKRKGGRKFKAENRSYSATESSPGIFFFNHGYNNNKLLHTCVILDLNRGQVLVVDGEIPSAGDREYRVRKDHVGGVIGKPVKSGGITEPPFPRELAGKWFVAEYSERYAWELVYMNDHLVSWQGLKGNPGIGDTEDYHASSFEPGVYAVSWSEKAETLAAVFLYNFNTRTITGHMWGYAPELNRPIHAPLGGRIVTPAEFGLNHVVPEKMDDPQEKVRQKNIDLVLRAHNEVWNQGRYEKIAELYDLNYQSHFICGMEVCGQNGMKEFVTGHHQSFPDWHEKVVDVVANGDRVVTRYVSTGTHQGEFQGIPATGRKVTINEVSIHRVLNGKIVEQWGFPDGLSHVQQLTNEA